MPSFRQLLPAVSLALLVLQMHLLIQGDGHVLARPVQPKYANSAFDVLLSQPRSSSPDTTGDDGQTIVDPEAVVKALQALANGMQAKQSDEGQKSSLVLSHGEGDVISANGEHRGEKKNSVDKNQKDRKDSNRDVGSKSDKDRDTKGNDQNKKTKEGESSDKTTNISSKAVHNALQQQRTRFCAQPANMNRTIDDISQNLVKAERKRLAAIRKQRDSKSSSSPKAKSTEFRLLTDAKILAEQTKNVQVVWHVIHSGSAGNISDAMIQNQIQTLNRDYKAYGFGFDLNTTNRVDNNQWYRNISPDTNLQTEMKQSLRKGDKKTLNLYSVDFQNGLLGYATFPWNVQEDLTNDGVVFQYSTLPGGSETGYNLGKTVTHEVGHWLGLYHVFQGGCAAPGDFVDDTPPQSVATSGCPAGQDSCRGEGLDSIHNYMDYSSDACLTEFTEGQAVRMTALSGQFRSL